MLENVLVENIWLALALVSVVTLADYFLTIYGARLYQTDARRYFVFEGSYELTPAFQEDINLLRLFSRRFWLALMLSWILIFAVWWLSVRFLNTPGIFSFVLGALFLTSVMLDMRHLRNIFLFRLTRLNQPGLTGQMTYARWVILRNSGVELVSFAGLFLLLFLISGSYFLLGGATRTLLLGVQHLRWSGQAYAPETHPHRSGQLAILALATVLVSAAVIFIYFNSRA